MAITAAVTKQQAREALWRRGHLSWLLDTNQKALYQLFHENVQKVQAWLLSRRSGKTFSLCVLSIEFCIKNPRSVIKYVAPTKMQVERFIRPIINEILMTCPEDLKPEYRTKDQTYFFGNGSELQLCGAEKGNIESIRGGFAHIAIVDEAQDISDLLYAVNSVLLPTTLTTKGKVLISGTPPKNPDHDFINFIEQCSSNGTLIRRTIYDNPRLSKEDIRLMADAMGGEDSEDFRRECMCEIIKSKNISVIPEFDEAKMKLLVREHPKPVHYHPYVSIDFGYRDWTVVAFGYYDFKEDIVVIEDELVAYGSEMYLDKLANDILEKQKMLWRDPFDDEPIKPKKQVGDHNLIAMNEIKRASGYQLNFEAADKTKKHAGINFLRTMIKSNKLVIDPKCKTIIRHILNGKWASTSDRDTFGRCPQGSHYDGIDAVVYLVKAIDFSDNPYPRDYNSPLRREDGFFTPEHEKGKIKNREVYEKMFNLKPSTAKPNPYLALLGKGKK